MRVSLVGRLASLTALASLGALLVLWTSCVMCLHVAIDVCLESVFRKCVRKCVQKVCLNSVFRKCV